MAKQLLLAGQVQGVFCRDYCRQTAKKLNIKGSASNLMDGRVQVLLDCDDSKLINRFVEALQTNPHNFRFHGFITNVEVNDYAAQF